MITAGEMTQTWMQRGLAPLKRLLPRSIWQPIRAVATAIVTPIRFSARSGHWKSSIGRSARSASGAPIPWYTYPAIDFLSQRSFEGRNVLEFGGGQSTLWWSARARTVLTVEQDGDWYERLRSKIGSNVTVHHVPVDRVGRSVAPIRELIEQNPIAKFDVIVVDGHLRRELAAMAFNYLAPDGAIILDDAEGYGLYDETRDRDCSRIDFFGFAPGVSRRHCTSVVFVGSCFLLSPEIPIAAIERSDG